MREWRCEWMNEEKKKLKQSVDDKLKIKYRESGNLKKKTGSEEDDNKN